MWSLPFDVKKETVVEASCDAVYDFVSNFSNWKVWSPWLCQEPECPVDIIGNPGTSSHKQSWDGKLIGTGEMQLKAVERGKKLDYTLSFVKPWKSTAAVEILFDAVDERKTRVVWKMKSSLPIFLFWMRKQMSALIGMDYERGLLMLKDYFEHGEVLTESRRKGVGEREGFFYLGVRRVTSIECMPKKMEDDYGALRQAVEEGKVSEPDFLLSISYKYDMVNCECEFTAAYGYHHSPKKFNLKDYELKEVKAHRALQVLHKGAYRYLGNAWSTLIGLSRAKKLKSSKSIPMYEVYLNTPEEVPEHELETELVFPLR